MLGFGATAYMDDAQFERWCRLLARLAVLESRNPGKYLFHGTSAAAAAKIARDGFVPEFVPTQGVLAPRKGVYWGTVKRATNFAIGKGSDIAGFPVIIVARTSDVMKAGTPHADLNYLEDGDGNYPAHATWEESMRIAGAMVCLDCWRVQNIKIASSAMPGEVLAPIVDVMAVWQRETDRMMKALIAVEQKPSDETAIAIPVP